MSEQFDSLICSGCGSSKVILDPKTRIIICNQCGKEEKYTRRKLNANGKVVNSRENAIKFFIEGNYDSASRYAQEVLNMSMDNAPALYISAYFEDVCNHKRGNLESFFKTLEELPIEYDEVEDLMKLFVSSPAALIDYEANIIKLVALNLDVNRDRKQMSEFFDTICPYFINRKATINAFSSELMELYKDLASHVGIPKTVYALTVSVQKNPGSPFVKNQFFLKTSTEFFWKQFMQPVGEIVDSMLPDDYKPKLQLAYSKLLEVFKRETKI